SGWPDSNRRPLASEASALARLRHIPSRVCVCNAWFGESMDSQITRKRVYSVVSGALDRGAGRQPWAGDGRGAGAGYGRLDRQTWSSATIPTISRVCIRAFMTITPDWSGGYVL